MELTLFRQNDEKGYNYFSFLPCELLELIIPYLDNKELNSFISIFNDYLYSLTIVPKTLSNNTFGVERQP